jgi:hypothetical protein
MELSNVIDKAAAKHRRPLIFSEIEELRRQGLNQSQIAELYGVSRQAVSWQKKTYGGNMTTRQAVNEAWPWRTTNLHSKSKTYQRLRDHGEFMMTAGDGMSADKLQRLASWWRKLRTQEVVIEFNPDLPVEQCVSSHGGFAYRTRQPGDNGLLIRVNEFTNLTEQGKTIWCWPSDFPR